MNQEKEKIHEALLSESRQLHERLGSESFEGIKEFFPDKEMGEDFASTFLQLYVNQLKLEVESRKIVKEMLGRKEFPPPGIDPSFVLKLFQLYIKKLGVEFEISEHIKSLPCTGDDPPPWCPDK